MITYPDVRKLIEKTDGAIFMVKFQKRSDGTIRNMVCQTNYVDGLSAKLDKKEPRDNRDYALVTVWSIIDKGYRSIPLDGVISLTIDGKVIECVQNESAML